MYEQEILMDVISDEETEGYDALSDTDTISDNESEDHNADDNDMAVVPIATVESMQDSSPAPDSDQPGILEVSHEDMQHLLYMAGPSKVAAEVKPEQASQNKSVEDDGQMCTICFEPWTNSSEHRLVSLRCGHLFGRSCITRWLQGQNSRCPQCNARARKSEIRNIYARTIKVLDTSERDQAIRALKLEGELRHKAEQDAMKEKLRHLMTLQECERLKKELMETKLLLTEARCGLKLGEKGSQSCKMTPSFVLEKNIDICKNGGCRIVEVCDLLGIIIVSQPCINSLFPGFGFRKISTVDMKPSEFVFVHQKAIKDMAFHSRDALVLTASLDRSIKITNILSNAVVQTYSVDFDAWSCAWDTDDPLCFYAGLQNGTVYVFDIRMTGKHVYDLPKVGDNSPVVAVQYLQKAKSSYNSKCGPLVAKLSNCCFYEKQDSAGNYRPEALPFAGPFTSLSYEPITGHFLVSCRPSQRQPRVSHTLCEFVPDGSEELLCRPVQTMLGGYTQPRLTRSKLLPHPDNESSLLVCAGDGEAALVWDGSSGTSLDILKTDSPVLDLAGLKINHKSFLLSLTDRNLRLYKWDG